VGGRGHPAANGYALAIDARDWDSFRRCSLPTCSRATRTADYHGIDDWLKFFIPFHDECAWTLHVLTKPRRRPGPVTESGPRATGGCSGTRHAKPGYINRAEVLFRDRLVSEHGTWRIARRKLDLLSTQPEVPMTPGVTLVHSVLDLATGRHERDHRLYGLPLAREPTCRDRATQARPRPRCDATFSSSRWLRQARDLVRHARQPVRRADPDDLGTPPGGRARPYGWSTSGSRRTSAGSTTTSSRRWSAAARGSSTA